MSNRKSNPEEHTEGRIWMVRRRFNTRGSEKRDPKIPYYLGGGRFYSY
ncbi:MAG: hypothetical protein R2744_04955 [Bacteroidales bacterium]